MALWIARLNSNGSNDNSFYPDVSSQYHPSPALQADGKIILGDGGTIKRLNVDGSLDNTFVQGVLGEPRNQYSWAQTATLQTNGKVLVAGFSSYLVCDAGNNCDYDYEYFIDRLNADGSRDYSFSLPYVNPYVIVPQSDGRLLVAGEVGTFYGEKSLGIFRVNSDGSPASGLDAGTSNYIFSIVIQPDGKILIGGSFSYGNFTNRNSIARLNADLSLDGSFNPGTGPNSGVRSVALQPDGKVIIGGVFTNVAGIARNRIARLNADGSLDNSFNPGSEVSGGSYPSVNSIVLQPDGNILIGGDFTTVNGVLRPYVARLHGDSAAVVAPRLSIARSNAFVIVSWPASAQGYSLQESTNLSPAGSWGLVPQPVTTNSGQNSVTVPVSATTKFFLLTSP